MTLPASLTQRQLRALICSKVLGWRKIDSMPSIDAWQGDDDQGYCSWGTSPVFQEFRPDERWDDAFRVVRKVSQGSGRSAFAEYFTDNEIEIFNITQEYICTAALIACGELK